MRQAQPAAGRGTTTGLSESLVVWVILAVVAIEIFVTLARTPAAELYQPQYAGPRGATTRALLFIAFPGGIVAIAVLPLVVARLRRGAATPLAIGAAALGATGLVGGVVEETEAGVAPLGALAVAGVAVAVVLTVLARRRAGAGRPRSRQRGDRMRLVLGVALLAIAPPWIAADLGLSLDRVPLLSRLFITDVPVLIPGRGTIAAVHDGHHHGMDGVLLALAALLISRGVPSLVQPALRRVATAAVSVAFVLGVYNAAQDFWGEQIAKRGWTSVTPPSVASLGWGWFLLALAAVAVGAAAGRTILRPAQAAPVTAVAAPDG